LPSTALMTRRALVLRCPVCGGGGLFAGRSPGKRGRFRLGLPESCPTCRLRFDREAGHWTGSLGLNVIVSFTALFVVLMGGVLLTWPNPPTAVIATVAITVSLLVPLVFAPWSSTLWLVIDLRLRPLEPHEAPGLAPDASQRTSASGGDADDGEAEGKSPPL
jgi:hypothetical protein